MGKLYLHYPFFNNNKCYMENRETFTQMQPVLRCNVRIRSG